MTNDEGIIVARSSAIRHSAFRPLLEMVAAVRSRNRGTMAIEVDRLYLGKRGGSICDDQRSPLQD